MMLNEMRSVNSPGFVYPEIHKGEGVHYSVFTLEHISGEAHHILTTESAIVAREKLLRLQYEHGYLLKPGTTRKFGQVCEAAREEAARTGVNLVSVGEILKQVEQK